MALSKISFLWLHIIPLVPSLMVTTFILYYLLKTRVLRTALNNHVIILMLLFGLVLELTDTIWFIYFFRTGSALSLTHEFCLAWAYIDSSLFASVSLQMSWATIERHIIIFHSNLFATKRKRFFFHYLPLFIVSVWPLIFYFVTLLILPCNLPFDYNRRLCGHYDCINLIEWIAIFDSIAHYMVPSFITLIFSITLFVRVLYHKCQIGQRIDWRNYKKMALQLLSISLIYMVLDAPPTILNVAYLSGLSSNVASDYYNSMLDLSLWIILFTPFACITSLPDLKAKCKNLITFRRRTHAVRPAVIITTRRNPNQIITTARIIH
ncbi:unnamed protein product [Adineta steineri]|uniref:G-protein coupled receptors family 1 profile domain-containing protein n=1 Tax=Adineta steineri TaxID=433720 RepID=A0A814RKA0_9BILA|nr:unnamed protein product [Adineta steineri]CAF1134048.1 unnamed protein product [Adineta steineri]